LTAGSRLVEDLCMVIRRTLTALVVAAAVGAAPAQAATPGSFTGKVADDFILVGAHLGAQAADGSQSIRLYVCNSVPYTEWFTGTVSGGHVQLTSASGHASADVTVSEDAVTGTARLRGGVVRRFAIHRARGGAGIYEITISRGQRFAGRSFAGDVFVGQERGNRVTATIVTADNRARSIRGFNVMELSQRALRAAGLPTRYAGLGRRSDRPGRYIAVVTQVHGRLAFYGAEAAVIRGSKVSEIIGLDKMVQIGTVFTLAMPIALPPFPPLR
jgi:hypothetical protein